MADVSAIFPVLYTDRLDLVEMERAHAGDLFRLFTDNRVTEYYTVLPFRSENELLPVIESFGTRFKTGQGIRWGITLKGQKELIGTIGFQQYTPGHKGTIVFALMPEQQGKGYATEAIRSVMKYGFETLDLKRIEGEVMPGNTSSEKVLTKVGFTHEGLLKQWIIWDGACYDMNMYSMIKNEKG